MIDTGLPTDHTVIFNCHVFKNGIGKGKTDPIHAKKFKKMF